MLTEKSIYVVHNDLRGEEVCAAGRTTGKKAFAAPQARMLLPHHRQDAFAAPQARMLLPHHRQERFCRTTGKEVFTVPQTRRVLPHHRQEGFCRTSGEMVLLQHNGQTIFLLLQIRVFFLLTGSKCEDQQ